MNKAIENFRNHPALSYDPLKLVFKIESKVYSIIDGIVRQIIPQNIRRTNIGDPYRDLVRLNFVFVDDADNEYGECIDFSLDDETALLEVVEPACLDVLILNASVRGDYLFVTNKVGREIRVSFEQIPALNAIRECDRIHFTIQENGSCLHWEYSDTHLDFESFLYYVDDAFRQKCDKQKSDHNRKVGKAIAIVRTVYQIPIDGIAGLEPKEVQDIEAGRICARASNLCCYSEAIGITLDEFLKKVAVLSVFEE